MAIKGDLCLMDNMLRPVNLPDNKASREKVDTAGMCLVDRGTGEIVSKDVSPKFNRITYAQYTQSVVPLEAMSAKELSGEPLKEYLMGEILGEQKLDGHRALCHVGEDSNRFFSKRISKKTGWYSENTDTVPHLRDCLSYKIAKGLTGTILDTELIVDIEACSSTDVQSVTGAKPVNALYSQLNEKGFATPVIFDVPYYKGVCLANMTLAFRKLYAFKAFKQLKSSYFRFSTMYLSKSNLAILYDMWDTFNTGERVLSSKLLSELKEHTKIIDNYEGFFHTMLAQGKEGIMLKSLGGIYEPKVSSAFVKMKEHSTFDVVIVAMDEASKEYCGEEIQKEDGIWGYWESKKSGIIVEKLMNVHKASIKYIPVTKLYAKGWIGAIRYGVYKNDNLIEVGRCSGMTEEERALISRESAMLIKDKAVIEVEAQGFSDKEKGSLRHPRFFRFRPDKDPQSCTWRKHLRI